MHPLPITVWYTKSVWSEFYSYQHTGGNCYQSNFNTKFRSSDCPMPSLKYSPTTCLKPYLTLFTSNQTFHLSILFNMYLAYANQYTLQNITSSIHLTLIYSSHIPFNHMSLQYIFQVAQSMQPTFKAKSTFNDHNILRGLTVNLLYQELCFCSNPMTYLH